VRTAFELPDDQLNEQDRDFLEAIREHGWFATHVFDSEGKLSDFSYSTGFWLKHRFPELILFGLPRDVSHHLLWQVFRDIVRGTSLPLGVRLGDVLANADAFLMPVAKRHYEEHLGWCRWFYRGEDFPAAQLIWPDEAGLFPWEPGFAESLKAIQPDLTEKGWLAELAH